MEIPVTALATELVDLGHVIRYSGHRGDHGLAAPLPSQSCVDSFF